MDVPFEILDRDVARAHADLAAARADLARLPEGRADAGVNPLGRHDGVSRRASFLELSDRKDKDEPLGIAVRRWVHALTLERVLWPDTVRLAAAWREASITVSEAAKASVVRSPRDLLVAVLSEPTARRRIFADALARGAAPVQDAVTILHERRLEAARLLGANNDAIDLPIDDKAFDDKPRVDLDGAATRLLQETSALVARTGHWAEAVSSGVARDAAEGWPARLGVRWLVDLFDDGPLTEGLRLDVGRLPVPIGASSFARALEAFGAALARADGPSGPWCLAHAPFDLRVERRGALFGALAADPVFATTRLGLGRGRARDQARTVARAAILGVRLDAARVLARRLLGLPSGELASRFEEITGAALGVPIPTSLAGVVPRLGPHTATRFVGIVVAANDRRRLIDRFDEDWFKSPHAARAIREEDATARMAPVLATQADLDAGVTEITRSLADLT